MWESCFYGQVTSFWALEHHLTALFYSPFFFFFYKQISETELLSICGSLCGGPLWEFSPNLTDNCKSLSCWICNKVQAQSQQPFSSTFLPQRPREQHLIVHKERKREEREKEDVDISPLALSFCLIRLCCCFNPLVCWSNRGGGG